MAARGIFRAATKADAAALAVLVDIAGEGLPAYLWSTLKAPGQSILEVGRERAARASRHSLNIGRSMWWVSGNDGGFFGRRAAFAAATGQGTTRSMRCGARSMSSGRRAMMSPSACTGSPDGPVTVTRRPLTMR